ncbi:hypothetical protein RUND412_007487 [Rhizina undulata]
MSSKPPPLPAWAVIGTTSSFLVLLSLIILYFISTYAALIVSFTFTSFVLLVSGSALTCYCFNIPIPWFLDGGSIADRAAGRTALDDGAVEGYSGGAASGKWTRPSRGVKRSAETSEGLFLDQVGIHGDGTTQLVLIFDDRRIRFNAAKTGRMPATPPYNEKLFTYE